MKLSGIWKTEKTKSILSLFPTKINAVSKKLLNENNSEQIFYSCFEWIYIYIYKAIVCFYYTTISSDRKLKPGLPERIR